MRACREFGVPFVPRGAGTGLSGGAVAQGGGVVIECSRMNRILEIDPVDRFAVVQPGVVNAELSKAAAPHGLFYAPDPSSQLACTIGGNVAENSGGPHTLKYGTTTNHVLALELVLPDGEVVRLGSRSGFANGYDLVGAVVGSEGTLGIVTEVTVRLAPIPERVETLLAIFPDVVSACRAVGLVIEAGLVPAALEIIDQRTIAAVEASVYAAGLPRDAGAVLLVELDGPACALPAQVQRIRELAAASGASRVEVARDAAERQRFWRARKGAFGAMGRLAPDLYVHDAVVPRARLPEVLGADLRDRRSPRPAALERLPCGRRQSAPQHLLRPPRSRRARARARRGRRDPGGLRRGGRRHHAASTASAPRSATSWASSSATPISTR